MKILVVSEDIPVARLGGAGLHAVLLANALLAAGHEVEMLGRVRASSVLTSNGFRGPLHTSIDFTRTGWREQSFGIFNPLRRDHLASRVLSAISRVPGPWDVVHYHGHHPEVGARAPDNVNFVQTLHDQGAECIIQMRFKDGNPCHSARADDCAKCATQSPNAVQSKISTYTVKKRRATAIRAYTRHKGIFVSTFLESRLRSVTAYQGELNTYVVHNFIDYDRLTSIAARAHLPNDSQDTKARVFMAGRVDEAKGFRAFLEAFTQYPSEHIRLRLAGDGTDLASLRRQFVAFDTVEFLGWLEYDEVVAETNRADVCVVPSIVEEACSTTVLEALALGRTVYALARGGTPELIRYAADPRQLRLFESIEQLAQAVLDIRRGTPRWPMQSSADVKRRLPEILAIYSARSETSSASAR